jgi:ribosome-associated protein
MIRASDIPKNQVEFSAIRASGAGGQNVLQASTAIHFRFEVKSAGLQETVKSRLLGMRDASINIDAGISSRKRTESISKTPAYLIVHGSGRTLSPSFIAGARMTADTPGRLSC